ncbi:hypothetical protein LJC60_11165, partial [Ruminococcaceae bacterium OttesenSCG-928-D13]|nr:hypothetical protein [Ruminococcaceae bacterium OttesenSCG-928-D13]
METIKGAFKYPVIILFFAILAALSVADMMTPTKAVSELENRPLTQAPAFSATALFNNEWTYQYGEYTRDQFIGRDSWISAQSGLEIALGKLEANGVWYAKDGYQIAKVAT